MDNEMSRGEALTRVAVLEAELAELRKRVCVPDVSTMARVLSDRVADARNIDLTDNWAMYGEEYIEDVRAMLAAAPAPVERNQCDGCQAGIPVENGMHRMGKTGWYADLMACTADRYGSVPVEQVEQETISYYERAHGKKSPTYGMSLDERIEHVGGRTNAAGYVEFDSVMAVSDLIDHVLRDSPAPRSALTDDPWKASCVEYDPAIHHNPDAKAWADLFVQTFPAQADQHELMLGWFANAMMAMHDHLTQKENTTAQNVAGLVEALELQDKFWAEREAELGCLSPEAAVVRAAGQSAIAAHQQGKENES